MLVKLTPGHSEFYVKIVSHNLCGLQISFERPGFESPQQLFYDMKLFSEIVNSFKLENNFKNRKNSILYCIQKMKMIKKYIAKVKIRTPNLQFSFKKVYIQSQIFINNCYFLQPKMSESRKSPNVLKISCQFCIQ